MDFTTSIARLRTQRAVASEQSIPARDVLLEATLSVPLGARGLVVLPHASSAGRFERSHCYSAEVLAQAGLGTLQVDLLTPGEEATLLPGKQGAGDVELLADRLSAVFAWLNNQPELDQLAVGVLASRTETAAALMAAERVRAVIAVVSKGGVADSKQDGMTQLVAPTLLILGAEELLRADELAAEFFGRHLA
jgi:putative phosphoribosyl transferase